MTVHRLIRLFSGSGNAHFSVPSPGPVLLADAQILSAVQLTSADKLSGFDGSELGRGVAGVR